MPFHHPTNIHKHEDPENMYTLKSEQLHSLAGGKNPSSRQGPGARQLVIGQPIRWNVYCNILINPPSQAVTPQASTSFGKRCGGLEFERIYTESCRAVSLYIYLMALTSARGSARRSCDRQGIGWQSRMMMECGQKIPALSLTLASWG
jgi:hypothetical protein